jgi:hypothetical protein
VGKFVGDAGRVGRGVAALVAAGADWACGDEDVRTDPFACDAGGDVFEHVVFVARREFVQPPPDVGLRGRYRLGHGYILSCASSAIDKLVRRSGAALLGSLGDTDPGLAVILTERSLDVVCSGINATSLRLLWLAATPAAAIATTGSTKPAPAHHVE